jgi:hypothetical protein
LKICLNFIPSADTKDRKIAAGMRCLGQVTCLKGQRYLEDFTIGRTIILKWISKESA